MNEDEVNDDGVNIYDITINEVKYNKDDEIDDDKLVVDEVDGDSVSNVCPTPPPTPFPAEFFLHRFEPKYIQPKNMCILPQNTLLKKIK